jgi:membrane-bound acyltransferase YfiQ involved in biofilm formation
MATQAASLKPVFVTTAAAGAIAALYGLFGVHPSPVPEIFLLVAPLVSVVFWTQNDARLRRTAFIQDWGFFIYLLWPILVPGYVFKTRGWGAWRFALGLLGVVLAPTLILGCAFVWHMMLSRLVR